MVTSHEKWLKNYVSECLNLDIVTDKKKVEKIVRFWNEFFTQIISHPSTSTCNNELGPVKEIKHIKRYRSEVYNILKEEGGKALSEGELVKLQQKIEDLTMSFDEKSMFKTAPDILNILIKKNKESAKQYMQKFLLKEGDLELELLRVFGQYTLEALIVHVLTMVFSPLESSSMVRVATLLDQLNSLTYKQVKIMIQRCPEGKFNHLLEAMEEGKKIKREKDYLFGTGLLQFMLKRELITITNESGDSISSTAINPKSKRKNTERKFYVHKNSYASCNFSLSLLPVKLNLPMVCPPLNWESWKEGKSPGSISDLVGGYLSTPSGEIFDRYRLLSSNDITHYYIKLRKPNELCTIINKLQSQSFRIKKVWLKYILENEEQLVQEGFIMPSFLTHINLKEASDILRNYHLKDYINKLFSYSELVNFLNKSIQRARFERTVIEQADAFQGYDLYFPASLDFRGRIYRSGIMHYHQREICKSLIEFSGREKDLDVRDEKYLYEYSYSLSFYYDSFKSINEASNWFMKNKNYLFKSSKINQHIIDISRKAKHPLLFLSNVLSLLNPDLNNSLSDKNNALSRIPISKDASASAYQIMSYLLLDEEMAHLTNLFTSNDDQINDVYQYIHINLMNYMKSKIENPHVYEVVRQKMDRKIVKSIFMPMIYGKTQISTANDLKDAFSHFLTNKDCFKIASICFDFWKTFFPRMECLIQLIRNIGLIVSARGKPVKYNTPYFITVQDYIVMDSINIYVYDKIHKKRRKVTLRVSSSKRNRKKTLTSTFVNFIHQKDAFLAMKVVERMHQEKGPIYTVHDNFISTTDYSHKIADIYCKSFVDMGSPLSIINEFICMNILYDGDESQQYADDIIIYDVIPLELLIECLERMKPDNLDKNKIKIWDNRISTIVESYMKYIYCVCYIHKSKKSSNFNENFLNKLDEIKSYCSINHGYELHKKHNYKWHNFIEMMKKPEGFRYCVHN